MPVGAVPGARGFARIGARTLLRALMIGGTISEEGIGKPQWA
jgi:hypothetical protein